MILHVYSNTVFVKKKEFLISLNLWIAHREQKLQDEENGPNGIIDRKCFLSI
jgi:hypothetical protein